MNRLIFTMLFLLTFSVSAQADDQIFLSCPANGLRQMQMVYITVFYNARSAAWTNARPLNTATVRIVWNSGRETTTTHQLTDFDPNEIKWWIPEGFPGALPSDNPWPDEDTNFILSRTTGVLRIGRGWGATPQIQCQLGYIAPPTRKF